MNNTLLIKPIAEHLSKRYFLMEGVEGNIIFGINRWESMEILSLEQIQDAFLRAKLPSYITENRTASEVFNQPLAIFTLTIFNRPTMQPELTSNAMSLWEYATIIKGEKDVPKALKMAYIRQDEGEDTYIICESYDSEAMTTDENIRTAYKYFNSVKRELQDITKRPCTEFEVCR